MATPGAALRSCSSTRAIVFAVGVFAATHTVVAVAAETPTPDPSAAASSVETDQHPLIYSVNRAPEPPFETARAVQVISSEDIWRRNARTLPEVLMEEAGIFVQQTNYGAGAPILRGLIGKQILLLVDGVKVNNATYRFGPVQYLNTIDLQMVERIEIVRGVGSVLGSDALGGTINIVTKKGQSAATQRPGGALFARYSSADQAATGHASVSGSGDRLRYFAGATYRDTSDVEGGGQLGEQPATGYAEAAASLSLDYFVDSERTISLSYHTLEQDDVPRTDRITDRTNLVFDFDPQSLQLGRLSYTNLGRRRWSDTLQLTLFWNRQEEGRQEIRTNRPTTERQHSDSQTVLGASLEMGSFVGKSHRLLYGIDYTTEEIRSTRQDVNLVSGAASPRRGNFTDRASYDSVAAYLQDRFPVGKRLTATIGARYNRVTAAGSEESSVGTLDLDSSSQDVSGAVSLVFHATPQLNLIASATRGFRPPNLDDLSVFDERSEGTEVPNPEIDPEHILAYEVGSKYEAARLSGSLFYYYRKLDDLIVRSNGLFDGLPYFDLNRNGVRDPSEPAVLQRQNIGEATVDGFELDLRYRLSSAFALLGTFTSTTGDDDLLGVPLQRVPPDFGSASLRWTSRAKRAPWAELVYLFASSQRRLAPADLADSRIGPGGTPGFDVLTLRGGISFGKGWRVSLALENLTDEEYKYHGSGVFRPGRQAVLGVEFRP